VTEVLILNPEKSIPTKRKVLKEPSLDSWYRFEMIILLFNSDELAEVDLALIFRMHAKCKYGIGKSQLGSKLRK